MTARPPARRPRVRIARAGVAIGLLVLAGCAERAELASSPPAPNPADEGAGWQIVLTTTTTTTVAPTTTAAPRAVAAIDGPQPATTTSTTAVEPPPTTTSTTAPATTTTVRPATTTTPTTAAPPAAAGWGGTTACREVLHIGDSTSVGASSPDVLADPDDRFDAQYRRVGVERVTVDASPGRSIVETRGQAGNAEDVARAARDRDYHGCWVIAIGTNDAANIGAGAMVGARERVRRVMALVGDDPVLWVDAVTFTDEGAWARRHMATWNAELRAALAGFPNARVFAWSSVARREWFSSDGVHEVAAGSREQARRFADALAVAFPVEPAGD